MSPKNPDDEASKASGADFSSYRRQTILDLPNYAITTEDIMSAQTGISQKKVDKIKNQGAKKEEVVGKNKYLREKSHSSFLQSSSSPNPQVGLNSIMKKSQTRVRKTLEGKPEFVMSFVETQNVLKKLAKYKTNFVVLHVDLVGSTKLAMRLPLDRLTMMIQAFNQEMSIVVKAFGGIYSKVCRRCSSCLFCSPSP